MEPNERVRKPNLDPRRIGNEKSNRSSRGMSDYLTANSRGTLKKRLR
jgi:hypothetical protein